MEAKFVFMLLQTKHKVIVSGESSGRQGNVDYIHIPTESQLE